MQKYTVKHFILASLNFHEYMIFHAEFSFNLSLQVWTNKGGAAFYIQSE